MRISDWSSDVCSSGLRRSRRRRNDIGQHRRIQIEGVDHVEHSLNLRRLERRFRTMTAAAARLDRWCEFRPLAKFSKRQRSVMRSEEHTSELQSLMRISYDVCFLIKN